ncbi:uncharacterized protein OCT59_004352 [Rhizophagus irregularis]|uniref:uncharacterized protein n=1 Tax=Rhizophagus irregularis TaxID=588596 RepID=UPI003332F209|nr:hypothetical protein OCT59_004352 [Rhizophagus irregularis]
MEQDNDNANENITLSTETDSNSNLRHRCFDCEFSGSGLKENNRINKRNKGITKFVNNHNHQLLADTELFSTEFRSLSDDIKQDINYYVECEVCDFPTIRALLKPKYQNQFMLSQNLSNYIQKVKRDKADTYNDSARLLENLLAQQQEDLLMLVISRIDPITLRLTAQNSITVEIFEKRWQNLVSKYSQTESYLHNILYKSKKSWAYCFTLRLFTGDIQSTQRIESLNGILHKAIESRLELGLGLRFITYKYAKPHYNQPYMVAVIFKNISTLISYWLSSNLFEEFKKQMVESVSYRARIVQQLEVLLDKQYEDKKIYMQEIIKQLNGDEIFQIWKISCLLSTSSFSDHYILLMTNRWHICTCLLLINSGIICRHYFKLMMETNDAKFHISMVPRRWFKENLQSDNDNINQSLIITLGEDYTAEVSNNDSFNKIDFNTEQPSIYQQIKESGLQKQVKKKNEFSSMISLAKTTINLAVEVGDQMHFKKMLTEY